MNISLEHIPVTDASGGSPQITEAAIGYVRALSPAIELSRPTRSLERHGSVVQGMWSRSGYNVRGWAIGQPHSAGPPACRALE